MARNWFFAFSRNASRSKSAGINQLGSWGCTTCLELSAIRAIGEAVVGAGDLRGCLPDVCAPKALRCAACAASAPGLPRRRNTKRIAMTASAINATKKSSSKKAPDKPKWESKAAIPKPAKIPANGAINRDKPLRCAAADCPEARLALGVARDDAAGVAALGGGTARRCFKIFDDCRPKLKPPPKRRASASKEAVSITKVDIARTAIAK